MADDRCHHEWKIINIRDGYLVTEGCMRTGDRANFFALQDRHHMDTYYEGDHYWRFMGSSQAVKFDLECGKCGEVVKLDRVQALAMCVGCKEDCKAALAADSVPGENVWVYLALCNETLHESGECVNRNETEALTEYFNARISTPDKRIIFVPCILRASIDYCQAEIIADIGMKDID